MFSGKKTDLISWLLLIGLFLLILELIFRGGELIFIFAVMAGCIYVGGKRRTRTFGKLLYWGGWFGAAVTLLNMMAFKFVLVAILIYLLIQVYQNKKRPAWIKPEIREPDSRLSESLFKKKNLFKNIVYGPQQTPDHVYEWEDINIQCGIGDTVIDLSNTVLPEGESVITVRNIVGNIKIFVPYEVAVSVHHSVFAGNATIFDIHEPRVFNQLFSYHTDNYYEASQRIKIITTLAVGDLEVKRT
ncbi:lia operon protein LiaF [Fictibacillus enclensis]|uniref:Cell wall-active antibiotics response protein n=1 Tax=Fictibacillus enclensis TaxID=1017270 RepID=A0A0V8J4B8_9BACL|nr:cell wall-active antibiotics response protein LiaF [Fictibacillus enclensis]KSU81732.1 cell wall-active antibiotics response protein [Fictibacillus enclensis]SCC25327.1 lia operon protein LiaF [Fictibacillus enclensis]